MKILFALHAFYLRYQLPITGLYFLFAFTAASTVDYRVFTERHAVRTKPVVTVMDKSLCAHDSTSPFCKGVIQ